METFNHEGSYTCECGKTFINSQSFNGHKSSCKVHQIAKHGSLDFYNERIKLISEKSVKTQRENNEKNRQQKLARWISEQHTCEKCGKVISEVIKEKIASIGEKITVRRFVRYEGNVASYIHNGKIGVLLSILVPSLAISLFNLSAV